MIARCDSNSKGGRLTSKLDTERAFRDVEFWQGTRATNSPGPLKPTFPSSGAA
jgi:hypothetical protein